MGKGKINNIIRYIHKKLFWVIVPLFLFTVAYLIAYYLSGFDLNVYIGDGQYWYEVTERHYWGAFYWKDTWYVWLIYVLAITLFELAWWMKNK